MLKWLGLNGEPEVGEVPLWAGVPRSKKWLAGAIWLAVAVAAFAALKLRLPADDGFGGFLPVLVAMLVFSAGSSATERSLVRIGEPAPRP
ncbi:hypothetical protein ACFY5D_20185 [Paeniglutamicibacter sp. NPDC012692]|uniref:hypothetical protein n=1 Tax=Paeniglutamicibacter sp. NPDC012692 TaxID=3364388 RepID=UPI0036CAFCB2